jgi:hypothetical protein
MKTLFSDVYCAERDYAIAVGLAKTARGDDYRIACAKASRAASDLMSFGVDLDELTTDIYAD